MLEPTYGEGVDEQLDAVENDSSRVPLWNAICDTLEIICTKPESHLARQRAMRIRDGGTAWRVLIREPQEPENWSIIWFPDGDEAVILYVGPWPPLS